VMATGVWLMGFRTYRYAVFRYTLNFEWRLGFGAV